MMEHKVNLHFVLTVYISILSLQLPRVNYFQVRNYTFDSITVQPSHSHGFAKENGKNFPHSLPGAHTPLKKIKKNNNNTHH